MIFRPDLALAILRGEKTATRRAINPENPRSPWRPWDPADHSYPVGNVFTVNPGRGIPRVAECEVTGRRIEPLIQVDDAAAKREGFTNRAAFIAAFVEINGAGPVGEAAARMRAERVHVVEFKLHGPDCMGCDGCGWCEGSPAWTCTDCFGTGIEVTPAGRALVAGLA
jgi:hypothetical protein